MIILLISKTHKFIFIHIYKTAGSSITNALLPFVENHFEHIVNGAFRNVYRTEHRYLLPKPYPKHATAQDIISDIGIERFKAYYSFAIVRNPWDWQVSLYNYMQKEQRHHQHKFVNSLSGFDGYIRWRCREEVRFQKDFICSPDNKLLIDHVGRFEQLEQDFADICSKINIRASLPKVNVSSSKPYQSYYDNETRKLVRNTFASDIEMFGYEF